MKIHRVARLDRALSGPPVHCKSVKRGNFLLKMPVTPRISNILK